MKVTNVEKKENSTVELTIQVEAADFEAAVQKAYLKNRSRISVPGFRKGKAPRKIIESMYGTAVFYEDAINDVYPAAYEAAVQEQGLEDMGHPVMDIVEVGKEQGLIFTALVSVRPEVKLGQYKGLTAPKDVAEVTEQDIDAEMEPYIKRATRQVSVDTEIRMGDTAVIDFEGFDNGVAFEGGKGENYSLEIGSGSFVPGFEDQLIGMKAGEEKEINITFPEDYVPDLAGKAVVFKVKVNEVKEPQVPQVDDEFEEAILKQLVDNMQADIPDGMVETQLDKLMDEYAMRMQSQGMSVNEYLKMMGMTPEMMRSSAKPSALRQVQIQLALNAVAEAEKIEISDEDCQEEIKKLAEQYKLTEDQVKAAVPMENLKSDLRLQKASDLVIAEAKVGEAPKAEETEEKPKKTTRKKKTEEAAEGEEKPKRTRKKKVEETEETPAE